MDKKTWDEVVWCAVFAGCCINFMITGWELYKWLKVGHWPDNTLGDWMKYFEINLTSVYYPTDWAGIAKIGQWFLKWPISIILPMVIILATWIVKCIVTYED